MWFFFLLKPEKFYFVVDLNKMVTIFLFLLTLLIKKTIPAETGYLFKDLNDSNNDSDNKNLLENNLANSCQLQVFTDLKDNESTVFGGNGFNYGKK